MNVRIVEILDICITFYNILVCDINIIYFLYGTYFGNNLRDLSITLRIFKYTNHNGPIGLSDIFIYFDSKPSCVILIFFCIS